MDDRVWSHRKWARTLPGGLIPTLPWISVSGTHLSFGVTCSLTEEGNPMRHRRGKRTLHNLNPGAEESSVWFISMTHISIYTFVHACIHTHIECVLMATLYSMCAYVFAYMFALYTLCMCAYMYFYAHMCIHNAHVCAHKWDLRHMEHWWKSQEKWDD